MTQPNNFVIRDKVYKIFGPQVFEQGLFYLYEQALRFELSVGESFVEMFHQALAKGIEILDDLFGEQDDTYACISFYGRAGLLANLTIFKQLARLNIKINKSSCEIWQEQCEPHPSFPDEMTTRTFIIIPIGRVEMLKLLWSAIAADFDIRPRVTARVDFFSLELKILAHPYDDRGMDIIGTNYEVKRELFNTFNHYLLDYDREAMNRSFGNS